MLLAVDPGLTGAIAFLHDDGTFYKVEDMAVTQAGRGRKVKNEVNAAALYAQLHGLPVPSTVVIERVHSMPKMASGTVFSMGDSFGVVRGVTAALGIPTVFVDPREWKKHFGLSSDKEQSRAKAVQLYPTAPLSRVKDHNRAESILICRWYWETKVKGKTI